MSEITMLPPYIEPRYREILASSERELKKYSEALAIELNDWLISRSGSFQPRPEDIARVERLYREDPLIMAWSRNIGTLKSLVESPRFLIRSVN